MPEPGLVALPVVQSLDVAERDRAQLAPCHGFPVTMDVADLLFDRRLVSCQVVPSRNI